MATFTQLEQRFLETLVSLLYAEPGFSDVDVNDIAAETGIDQKTLRGVMGSLVSKGVIDTYKNDSGYVIIYLHFDYWYLHPEWKDAGEEW